ncbi:MAG: Na+/H+ antiporter subunit E [Porticoccaceae bacterium]|jgi:multicomponent K+:H+ antiporter subunit E|nr:Na+/H+ antiporter subunit E [Porticoccaceae bacterium]HLS99684.1 Na+/H+ antiporter subunit E [Porticoccaceae bacterium]
MGKWLPLPLTSLGLALCWLLLNQTLAPAHLLLALVLAVAIPLLLAPLQPLADPVLHRPLALCRLLLVSGVEIIRSCFNVSRIILFARHDALNSQFIRVPLDLRNRHGLALLSCLINSTPGTVWVEILPERHELALHVFDLHDEQWWVETIKRSYEQPLIEIFEGRPAP